jgi:hypothetical protein
LVSMTQRPTFFFSHARQDREMPGNYLQAFFSAFEQNVAQFTGSVLKEGSLGTIDSRAVEQGEDWDLELSGGLSNDKAFVAIMTPVYFNRPNCGKELAAFLLRHPNLGIDSNGALTGVSNVLPIRWMPESAYTANTGRDSLIPPVLRRIEDTPADKGRDAERSAAIERYRTKGMQRCVDSEPYYSELLELFAVRIRDMAELPPAASEVSFATAIDAFKYDWAEHLTSVGRAPVAVPSTGGLRGAPVMPRALASIVAFYVTRHPFTRDPDAVHFADQLVAEPVPGGSAPADTAFDALVADVRAAGVAEQFTVFHAAAEPAVPDSPEALLGCLTSLSEARVLTALIVDATVWPGSGLAAEATAIEQIIRSDKWTGPVFLPGLETAVVNLDKLVASRGLPSRLVALPEKSEPRVAVLRQAFVEARGRMLRTSTDQASNAERLPMLKGVGKEGA